MHQRETYGIAIQKERRSILTPRREGTAHGQGGHQFSLQGCKLCLKPRQVMKDFS